MKLHSVLEDVLLIDSSPRFVQGLQTELERRACKVSVATSVEQAEDHFGSDELLHRLEELEYKLSDEQKQNTLRKLGVTYGQGYYFAKSAPASKLLKK